MKIEYLSYLLEVLRLGSVNSAAKSLYLSQSGLSTIIKSVEAELGYRLFTRSQIGIVPTPEGKLFFELAERITQDYQTMLNLSHMRDEMDNLSIISSRFAFAMHCFFDFIRNYPKGFYSDTFQEFGIDHVLESIYKRKGRIGILVVEHKQLPRFQKYIEEHGMDLFISDFELQISILMSEKHSLAAKEAIRFDELESYRFVADVDVSNDDIILENANTVLRVSDRASTYDAINFEGYISTILSVDEPDAIRHGCVCRPMIGSDHHFVTIFFKLKTTDLNSREYAYLDYLSTKLSGHVSKPPTQKTDFNKIW